MSIQTAVPERTGRPRDDGDPSCGRSPGRRHMGHHRRRMGKASAFFYLESRFADVTQALLRILRRQRSSSPRTPAGRLLGSVIHSGSRSKMPAIASEVVSPPNGGRPESIS